MSNSNQSTSPVQMLRSHSSAPSATAVAVGEPLFGSRASGPQAQAPQSCSQVTQSSLMLQVPLPQLGGQAPQSPWQERQFSPGSQVASPHIGGHEPQSAAQLEHVSVPSQVASPQVALHSPQ